MAKKPLEEGGIHRAKLWEIALYACNNTSTNAYMMLVSSISYFLVGIVGVGVVLAGSLMTTMRIWDGVTDPFVGMFVDNTNTKFGKNRPFILIGQIIMIIGTLLMFNIIPRINPSFRFIVFIIIYMIYIVGYTAQCVVTKSAQSCLTNDPEQRPMFAIFDGVYMVLLMSVWYPIYLSGTLIPNFTLVSADPTQAARISELVAQNPALQNVLQTQEGTTILSGFYNPDMWSHMQFVFAMISFVLAILAIIGLWRKDNSKYFGTGKVQRVSFRDYADVLAHNRGIQMLVVAASSDKLSMNCMSNSTVTVCLYGIIFGNYALSGSLSAITSIPMLLFTIFGIGTIARKLGQKACLVVGTWGAMLSAAVLAFMIYVGHDKSFLLPAFSLTNPATWGSLADGANWSLFAVLFMIVYVLMRGFAQLSSNIVIPMTADCADYEVYRTGKYVPGLMGTLFSFVDKLISSLASTIVALLFSTIGFVSALPDQSTPFSNGILIVTLICFIGMPMIGWILNVVAMKFYPLTKEKMAEIQDDIARIKAQAMMSDVNSEVTAQMEVVMEETDNPVIGGGEF